MRVAIVDQGTNSTRLLLARIEGGRIAKSQRFTTVTRLGQGVDEHHRLDPEAMVRTRAVIAGFVAEIVAYKPHRSLLVATSVLRDARDGHDFLDDLGESFNLAHRVIDGPEEAALSFRAAAAAFPDITGRLVVVDIGGGSTEFSVGPSACAAPPGAGQPAGASVPCDLATPTAPCDLATPTWLCSLDVGVVRVNERFFAADPPSAEQWQAAAAFVREQFAGGVPAAEREVSAVVGVSGTFTTLVAHKLRLRDYDSARVHGHVLTLADIEAAQTAFRRMTSAQRGELPGIQPGREDVILAGTLLAAETCRLFGLAEVRVSEADLLDGAALWLAEQP